MRKIIFARFFTFGVLMDLRKLKTLIDLVAESNITELEVTEGEEKVKIVKGGQGIAYAGAPAMAAAPMLMAAAPSVAVPTTAPVVAEGKTIKSPMVGTFYAAPAPDKPDFVTAGMAVKAAQTVCIIEAMKLLNEIEAGMDGTIIEVLVQNGAAVEFGQPLFVVA
jgi:acetyl-CoA carboxylase biotin carboxyl carrier protein